MRMGTLPVPEHEALWTEEAAAAYLGISPRTLQRNRVTGGDAGPPYLKVGRLCRYRKADLDRWLDGCLRSSTSESNKRGQCIDYRTAAGTKK